MNTTIPPSHIIIASGETDWWLVAGTIGLALLTGGLMIATFKAVRAANRTAAAAEEAMAQGSQQIELLRDELAAIESQASIATRMLEIETTPILVQAFYTDLTPEEFHYFDVFNNHSGRVATYHSAQWWQSDPTGPVWIAVTIRNTGRGSAVIGRDLDDVVLQTAHGGKVHGWISTLVIAPGDNVWVAFADPRTPSEHAGCLAAVLPHAALAGDYERNQLSVVIRYSDISGHRWTTSHMSYVLQAEGRLQQKGVDLEPDTTP
jgi:hypothetical protein